MGFLDGLLNGAENVGKAAVQAAPYAASVVSQRNTLNRQQMLQTLALQRQQAETNLKLALGARTLRTPVLGDPSYAQAQGDVAGAEAQAKVNPAIATAVGTAAGTAPIDIKKAVDTAAGVAPIHTQEAVATAAGTAPIKTQEAINTEAGTQPIKTAGAIATNTAKLPGELAVAQARAGMAPRVQSANAALPQIDTALQTLQQYNAPGAAGRLFSHSALGGYAVSNAGQIANQAADQFVQAYLSGRGMRNAPPAQVSALKKQIQIQPGEEGNAAVIASKQQRLQQMRDEVSQLGRAAQSAQPDAPAGTSGAGSIGDVLTKYGIKPVKSP